MVKVIDQWDWHSDSEDFPKDMPDKNGGNPIGYFMEYLYKNDFLPNSPNHAIEEYKKVKNGEVSGLDFLMENCDGKFWDVDTNEEGIKFTDYIYIDYSENIDDILGYSTYEHDYSAVDYKKVEKWLDGQFTIWSDNGRSAGKVSTKKNTSKKGFWNIFFKK